MRLNSRPRPGMKLIEVLVVVALIGVFIALFLPWANSDAARRTQCAHNLREIGRALHQYAQSHGVFPPGGITWQESPMDCSTPRRGHSLFTLTLKYLEEPNLYNAINFSFAAKGKQGTMEAGAVNYTGLSARVATYICPSDSRQVPFPNRLVSPQGITYNPFSQGSYAGVVGTVDIFRWSCGCPVPARDSSACFGGVELTPDGMFGYNHAYGIADVRDGLSQTLFLGELRFPDDPDPAYNIWNCALSFTSSKKGVSRPQALATTVPRLNARLAIPDVAPVTPTGWKDDPANLQFGQFGFRSAHAGGAHFLLGDGSARFLRETISIMGVYRPLSTRASGEKDEAGAF